MTKKLEIYLEQIHSKSLVNNYEVRPSPIHGRGVFSTKTFKKGELVNTHLYPDEKGVSQTTHFGGFLNHSTTPNALTKQYKDGFYKTFAKVDMKPGDEITLDYTKNKTLEQPEKDWK